MLLATVMAPLHCQLKGERGCHTLFIFPAPNVIWVIKTYRTVRLLKLWGDGEGLHDKRNLGLNTAPKPIICNS